MARIRRRRIRIDGADYRWAVRRIDPGHVVVRVWHAGRQGGQLEVRVAFDDPWLNYGPIVTAPPERVAALFALAPVTPKLVAELIQAARASGQCTPGDTEHGGTDTRRSGGSHRLSQPASVVVRCGYRSRSHLR